MQQPAHDDSPPASPSRTERRQPTLVLNQRRYKPMLIEFMSFRDKTPYDADTEFTTDHLMAITPEEVCAWMHVRAYGSTTTEGNHRPIHARASTLGFAKKAISSFMPESNRKWDPETRRGNPTRSDVVNALVKQVRLSESRQEGAVSLSKRPLEFEEFMMMLTRLRSPEMNEVARHQIISLITLQWHLIARMENMVQLKFSDLASSAHHDGAIRCRMQWIAKSMSEEDSPEHIVFGSLDPRTCPLLNLAIYLESTPNVADSEFVFGNLRLGDRVVRRILDGLMKSYCLQNDPSREVSTRSLRNGAATYASQHGVPRRCIDRRGRWRARHDIADYSTESYPDAVAACVLVGPFGPCSYKLKDGFECVTEQLLVDGIGRSIKVVLGNTLARKLALSLLWAALLPPGCFDFEVLPASLLQRVREMYICAGGKAWENPVERVSILIVGRDYHLQVSDGRVVPPPRLTPTATVNSVDPDVAKQLAEVNTQLFDLKRMVGELTAELTSTKTALRRAEQRIDEVLQRVEPQTPTQPTPPSPPRQLRRRAARQIEPPTPPQPTPMTTPQQTRQRGEKRSEPPASTEPTAPSRRVRQRIQQQSEPPASTESIPTPALRQVRQRVEKRFQPEPPTQPIPPPVPQQVRRPVKKRRANTSSLLSRRPRSLYELWEEYVTGIDGRKAAKDFTPVERGANKVTYSRRKVFWDVVSSFVQAKHSSEFAIEKIYAVYGRNKAVSSILTALQVDRRNGGHPSLRV